jgi:hypothetical protein
MFFEILPADITTLTGYISGLIGDFMPIILIILGITVGLFIFRQITK